MSDTVILGAARTPIGAFLGGLAPVPAPKLGAIAIKCALERAGVRADEVDEVFMGNVVQAGVGQAPARQAALAAGIPNSVPCTTINKVCGSGLKSVMLAATQIAAGEARLVVAGGMESMSNAPYLARGLRAGLPLGEHNLDDANLTDRLMDAYGHGHLGLGGELGANPLARIVAQAQFAHEPERFLAAPKGAIERCLAKAGWSIGDVDLFEVNEAFSGIECVRRELDIPEAKFNVNGGAVALGHPIGASGARLLVPMLYALRARSKKRGIASLCLGGGEAVALAVR